MESDGSARGIDNEAVETLGHKEPHFGRVDILLSVKAVEAVADVVSLKKALEDLKDFIGPPKRAHT